MGRVLTVSALALLLVRVQFGLLHDAVVVEPLFVAAVHAALTLRGSRALWLAAALGLAGDWLSGQPLGLQGTALVVTAYLAFRASRHLLVSARGHLFLLTLALFVAQEGVLRAVDWGLDLRAGLPLTPYLLPAALLSALLVAALGIHHEEREPV